MSLTSSAGFLLPFMLLPLSFFLLPFTSSIFSVILVISLTYASYVDLKRMEIPDFVSIGLFPLGAVWLMVHSPDLLVARLLGAMLVLLLLSLFARLFFLARGRQGLGFGDIKLAASATVWIGLPAFPLMILLAATSGLIASFYRFDKRRESHPDARIPLGPHLAMSIWIVWFLMVLDLPETRFLGLS
jgi:leader peptidase (prepilin peptidase)/N-methyltransferase